MNGQTPSRSPVAYWLYTLCILVVLMIAMGGATRLTNSGLSITEWQPISGVLPPLSAEKWVGEFEKYQRIPEFSEENPTMSLQEFKFIYGMEWGHRFLGRLLGIAFLVPFLLFAFRGRIVRQYWPHYALIFLLGAAQGVIGWWMVVSGLTDRVDVSPYRLATHLGLAFIILGALFWLALGERATRPRLSLRSMRVLSPMIVCGLIFLQIVCGAFVAGLHAGKSYNTWPLMDGQWVPPGYFLQTPAWRNLFENIASVQFNHRILAYLILIAALVTVFSPVHNLRGRAQILLLVIGAQIVLGILTLLLAVPLAFALAHQIGGVLIFLIALWILHGTMENAARSVPVHTAGK